MMGRGRARRGVSLLDVLASSVVVSLLALPAISLLATSTHESLVSEDYMFAEALAQRILAESLARPWDELEAALPFERPIAGLPDEDTSIGRRFSEYARNCSGDAAFRGKLTARALADGFVRFEVTLSWPVKPGSRTLRQYGLLRLRCRHTLAVSTNFPLTDVTADSSTVGGGAR